MTETKIMQCPRCKRDYEAVQMFGGVGDLIALFDPADHSDPRPFSGLMHAGSLRCPVMACGERLVEASNVRPNQ